MFKNKKTEESEKKEESKYPEVCVGAVIVNRNGKILLARSNRWKNKYSIFGGHLEYGEKLEDGIKREIKEETGLDVEIKDRFPFTESIFDPEYPRKSHMIFCDCIAIYSGDDNKVKTNEEFEKKFVWVTPEESLKMDIQKYSMEVIEEYIKYSKNKDALDGWKRCQADFDNYRKRQDESRKQLKDFVLEDIALQILPVVDNFEMSLQHIPEDQEKGAWVQGILHIQRQLETVLKDNGIEEIKTKVGDKFDPNFHEAISHETHSIEHGTKKDSENKIAKIVSKGYRIGDKIIRAVKVIVN
jgi:nucleoside triphosphatase